MGRTNTVSFLRKSAYPVAAHDAEGVKDDVVYVNYPQAENPLHEFHGDANCNGENERFLPPHSPVDQKNEKPDRHEQDGVSDQIDKRTRPSRLTAKLRQNGFERDIVGVKGREPARRQSRARECERSPSRPSAGAAFRPIDTLCVSTTSTLSPAFGVFFSSHTRPLRHSYRALEDHHIDQDRAVTD